MRVYLGAPIVVKVGGGGYWRDDFKVSTVVTSHLTGHLRYFEVQGLGDFRYNACEEGVTWRLPDGEAFCQGAPCGEHCGYWSAKHRCCDCGELDDDERK